ncbi:MAG: hypothetical protein ACK2UO_03700, partial [Caldilineaceae bacterium]
MNSRERRRLARDLHRAYEIIVDLEDTLTPVGGGGEQSVIITDLCELRELVCQLWPGFGLSGAARVDLLD